MQWFYAINGERNGPITDEQLAGLVANGTVTPDTLVWREGFASWEPWSRVEATNPLPEPSADLPPIPVSAVEDDEPDDESAEWSMDEFSARLSEEGFSTSVGGCLSRAWANYKSFLGLALGATLVGYLILFVAGMLPIIGMLSGIIIGPHINAGCAWIFLKRTRGEDVELGDVFEGFKRCYLKLLIVGLVQTVVMVMLAVMVAVPLAIIGIPLGEGIDPAAPPDIDPSMGLGFAAVIFVFVAAVFYLTARFSLTQIVAIDRPEGALDAYRLSWRITTGRFWTVFALMVVLVVLSLAGVLALFVGILFVLPMIGAVIAQLYHDASESAAGRPPE